MFEFGWAFWVLFFVVFFGCGRMCGWGYRRYRERGSLSGQDDEADRTPLKGSGSGRTEEDRMIVGGLYWEGGRKRREPARAKRRSGTRLEELQRKFVEGRLTLEEYERKLDELEDL